MGPFGYGNLGDAATQEAMLDNVRSALPDAEILGFSLNPVDTEARHGIKSFPIGWMGAEETDQQENSALGRFAEWMKENDFPRPLRMLARAPHEAVTGLHAFKALEGLDVLVLSGGGQLDDLWGGGAFGYPLVLLKWVSLARLRGARVAFVSVGAGPINADLSKRFIRTALKLADYRSFRDDASRALIESIGGPGDDSVFPDLAYSLDVSRVTPTPRPPDARLVVAVGPVGYCKPGCWPNEDPAAYEEFLEKTTGFVEWLLAQGHAVTFVPGEAHFDQLAISDLVERLAARGHAVDGKRLMRPEITTVSRLLEELAMSDIVVSSRFHGLLLAQALGKPVIGLSYQQKIDSLLGATGAASACFQLGTFTLAGLKQQFAELEANRDLIRTANLAYAEGCRERLARQYARVFGAG